MRATRWIGGLLLLAAGGCGEVLEPTEIVPLEKVPEAAMKTAQEKLPDVKFDTAWKEHEQEYPWAGAVGHGWGTRAAITALQR